MSCSSRNGFVYLGRTAWRLAVPNLKRFARFTTSRFLNWGSNLKVHLQIFFNIGPIKATLSISGRGLIALPAKIREAAGLRPLDNLSAGTAPEGILLLRNVRRLLASAIQHRCQDMLASDKTHFGRLYGQTIAGLSIDSLHGLAEAPVNETETKGGKANKKGDGK